MKKIVRLTEKDINMLVKKIIRESDPGDGKKDDFSEYEGRTDIYADNAGFENKEDPEQNLTERDLTRLVKRVMNEGVIFDELKGFYDRCGLHQNHQPTSSSNKIADDIYDSIDGIGTDEAKLIGAFKKMKTFNEFCSTKNSYFRIYESDMLQDIDGDVDSDDIWKELSRTVRSLFDVAAAARKQTTGGGAQRLMKEDKDNKKMDLKSDLRNIINDEYSEIEPSDLVEVLEELLHYAKNDVFRSKKPNKGYITKDDVIKNFKKNYN